MSQTAAASQLPDRTPTSLEERKVESAKVVKMVFLEFGLPSMPKPLLMEETDWDIFQTCISCSAAVEDFAAEETLETMTWTYKCLTIASSAIHQEFGMQVPPQYHGLMKATCILKPIIDLLRTLHGQ